LLADDSVTAQNMGRKILADAGYEVLTVNNGSAALKKIAEAKPEIIILDVYMPGYSGLEVCQRLKEAQETSRIPVLLTVGKLEPFKPEEAKRVRADGYIVKPFEASELLSALSKLEDKIVPRPEAAKPGRFARANAALDEARYDKSVATDEDSGWKNRIAFPPKKKTSTEPEDGDDPAIYNALNKDLRTVIEHKPVEHKPVDHKPAEKPHEAKPESPKVNLEALAPEGLPKDVTPEEIAALAAAAAQVKGKIAENKIGENKIAEVAPGQAPVSHSDDVVVESKPIETTTVDAPKASDVIAAVEQKPVEQKPEDNIESSTEKPAETSGEIAPSSTDVMAAIAALESSASTATHSGSGFRRRSTDEPVTMAMAAGAEYAVVASRWRAVPVALEAAEISLSLEHEMQKAYAPVAAESAAAQAVSAIAEVPPVVAEPVAAAEPVSSVHLSSVELSSIQVEQTQPVIPPVEPLIAEPPVVEPEIAQSMHAVANAATEAISAAVKELEAVAASYEAQRPPVAEVNSAPMPIVEASIAEPSVVEVSTPPAPEPTPAVESKASEKLVEAAAISEPEPKQEIAPEPVCEQPAQEEQKEEQKQEVPAPFANNALEPSVAISTEKLEASTPDELPAGGITDMGKESDIAQSTAAAWASWRRIRETGDAKPGTAEAPKSNSETKEEKDPRDVAAMAVAAGAESAPQESEAATDPDAGELASIVDSVLADLRPKIMAEISRKMGKKK